MKAVVYKEKGVFSLEEREVPMIKDPGDAVVRVTLCSICSSDIHIKHGSVPRAAEGVIVGHEMVGEVVEAGPGVKKFRAGDRVSVNVETFCGECFFCRKGFVNNCADEQGGWALGCRIDGGQAEYVRVPFADNGLNLIPENVSDEQALFTGDILATGYWAAQISEIHKGDMVLVLGAGPAGLCTLMCAALYEPGAVVCADISEERLEFVKSRGLADRVINPGKEDVEAVLKEMTEGRGADVVIEAAGGADTFQLAWKAARPNGIVCIVALYEEAQTLPLPDMYGKNLTFKTGGVDANACDDILALIAEGRIDTTCMITHRFSLDEIMEAYDIFENKRDHVMKIAVAPFQKESAVRK